MNRRGALEVLVPVPVPVLVLVLLLSATAWAHQQKESITRVLFNSRTDNIEVMHRFLLHDAEHAMGQLFGQSADLLGNPQDRERFEDYVHERFSILDPTGQSIALTPVGHEIDGEFLWVYAEAPIPEAITTLTVSHEALRDLWTDQTNLVNVERQGKIRTALFDGASTEITIEF